MVGLGKTFLCAIAALGFFDFIWLGFVAKRFNDEQLKNIAYLDGSGVSPHKGPALIVYLLMALALTVFAAPKALDGGLGSALGWGALLGLTIYGTYDLTNLSLLRGYSLSFAIVDICWGTCLFAMANLVIHFARNWLS